MHTGLTWQGFGGGGAVGMVSVRRDRDPEVEQSQFQTALKWTCHCPKLSPSVMLVAPL